MAGHFVLNSIAVSDLTTAQSMGCTWSPLAHGLGAQNAPGQPPHPGWNATTRKNLTDALASGASNRNGLPPHLYLGFGPFGNNVQNNPLRDYIRGAGWASQVTRPGLELVALCPAALAAWNAGNKEAAVLAQADFGAASIEIYYISGEEMS
jgi:hypothetical protein